MATTALNNSQPSTSSERPAQIPPVAHNFNKLKDILHDGNVAPCVLPISLDMITVKCAILLTIGIS